MSTLESRAPRTEHLAPRIARVALGLGFTVFGLNGFLGFMPAPELPPAAGVFLGGLASAGYMFPLIKGTELAAGLLLLAGRHVPLALTALAPILVNILLFHAVLAPAGLAMPVVLTAMTAYLAWTHRAAFRPMLASGTAVRRASEDRGSQRVAGSAA